MRGVLTAFFLLALGVSAGFAQASSDRFQIERTADGVIRLDRVTGAVDSCAVGNGGWRCETMIPPASQRAGPSDDGATRRLLAQKERLEERVARLERRLDAIAALAAGYHSGQAAEEGAAADVDDVSDARRRIDEAAAVTEYAVRRFSDLLDALSGPPREAR